MLVRHSRDEGGIGADLATTFEQIVAGRGYCADYVRVYLAAAASVSLFCRQWAFSFDEFGGHGHTVIEVYDRQRAAWTFIDVHNNVYAVLAGTETPIDALGLRHALLHSPESIEFRQAAPGRLGWPHFDKLLDYYQRGAGHWYLWWGNDVATREQRGVVRVLRQISGRLSHVAGSLFGSLPALVVLPTPENERAIVRMEALRRRVLWVGIVCVALFASLMAQLGLQFVGHRDA